MRREKGRRAAIVVKGKEGKGGCGRGKEGRERRWRRELIKSWRGLTVEEVRDQGRRKEKGGKERTDG